MGIFGAMDTSASGLTAQRLRLDLISNNIANVNTTRTSQTTAGGNPIPYSRQVAVFVPKPSEKGFADTFNQVLQSKGLNKAPSNVSSGVQVQAIKNDDAPFRMEYDPSSPDAARTAEDGIPVGYVRMSNVDIVTEMVDMISASRAYEANVTAMNASKAMLSKALEI